MDEVLQYKDLNMRWWNSTLCPEYLHLCFEYIAVPRGISLEKQVTTQCLVTCEALKYLLTGTEEWVQVEKPSGTIFQAEIGCEDHYLIVVGETVYQSYWNQYPLRKTIIGEDLLSRVRGETERQPNQRLFDYELLTGVPPNGIEDVITFFEPQRGVDFGKMEERYIRLLDMRK